MIDLKLNGTLPMELGNLTNLGRLCGRKAQSNIDDYLIWSLLLQQTFINITFH